MSDGSGTTGGAWRGQPGPDAPMPWDTLDDGSTPDDGSEVESASPDERSTPAPSRALLWVLVAALVVGAPVIVGLVAFLAPSASSSAGPPPPPTTAAAAEPAREDVRGEAVSTPNWTRPAWASTEPGSIALELAAVTDVPFGTGRMRPSLGVSCADGATDVHVVTGGTAHIEPETFRHLVQVSFDGVGTPPQPWIGASDQRALFAPDARTFLRRMAGARELAFRYTHYVSGSIVVRFALTGSDDIVAAMADVCGWGS